MKKSTMQKLLQDIQAPDPTAEAEVIVINEEISPGELFEICTAIQRSQELISLEIMPPAQIGNSGAIRIARMLLAENCLKKLLLKAQGIEDEGAIEIATKLKKAKALKRLVLTGNPIGNLGLKRLAVVLSENKNVNKRDETVPADADAKVADEQSQQARDEQTNPANSVIQLSQAQAFAQAAAGSSSAGPLDDGATRTLLGQFPALSFASVSSSSASTSLTSDTEMQSLV